MSQEPFALSTISPASIEEEERDYEAIRATVMQSARGRWFLEEYARRNRTADTRVVLSAIERIERLIRDERNYSASQDALAEVSALPGTTGTAADAVREPHPGTEGQPPARETSPGALEISALAERLQDVGWTMRERGLDPAICDQIESLASSILAASLERPAEHHSEPFKEPHTSRFVPVSDSAETAGAEQVAEQPLSPSADEASVLLAQEVTVSAGTATPSEACVPCESEISARIGAASETATTSECIEAIDNLGSDDLARIGALPEAVPLGVDGEPECQPKPGDTSVAPDAIAQFTAALAQPNHTDIAGAPEHAAAGCPTGEADASVELEDMAPADKAGQSYCAPSPESVARIDVERPTTQALNSAETLADPPEHGAVSASFEMASAFPTTDIEWSNADQANFGLAPPLLVSVAKVPSSAPDRLAQLQLDPLVIERKDAAPPQIASAAMPSEASGDMSQGDNTAENFGPGLEVSPVEEPILSETAGAADHQRADPATEAETVEGLTLQPQLIPAPVASEIIPEALPTSAAEGQPSMPVGEQLSGEATREGMLSVAPHQLTPLASQAIAEEIAATAEFQETAGQNRKDGSIDIQTGPADNLSGPTAPRATAGDAGDLMKISISLQAPAQERVAEPDTDLPPSQEPLSMSEPLQAISEATSPAPTETPIEVSAQTQSQVMTQLQCEASPGTRDSAAAEALRVVVAGDSPKAPIAPLRNVADMNEPLPLSFEESVFADEPTVAIASAESVPAMPPLLSDISHEDILSGAWEEAASTSRMKAPGPAQPDTPRLKRPLDALDPSKHDILAEPAAAGAPIPQEPDAIMHLEEELFATPLAAHEEVTPPARAPAARTPESPAQIDQTEGPKVCANTALQLEELVQAPALIEPAVAPTAPVRPVAKAMPRAAPSDPLAALKAMTEEERIAVFT